ncbi:hypothetical protein TCE0_011r00715 [Talaromyces pinophilus]|uniref:Carboxylesterase type B domain-containing protein n=1 Tax=Talaromyces pinophilus TaxID=128442 RepID=A0A0B8MXL7_TALPI|nr:hypothetical protein TCE0_011r00715 [Talaromyces pinophilus]
MFLSFLQRAAWALLSVSSIADALNPQVNLGYATYEGTSLSNGVKQFLPMRYAAPPLKENRFRRAVAPLEETGVVMAKVAKESVWQHGPVCYGVDQILLPSPLLPSPPVTMSEGCLYIDVYTPQSTETDSCATSDANGLPVMIWIQGGAFVEQFNPNYNGTGIVEASGGNAIVVTFNYRVGTYGFLASGELLQGRNLNLGLHDQRAAMSWVQSHISQFGGDPDRVTLFGTSIGGGSVSLQTLAYGGNHTEAEGSDNARWNAGIAASVYIPSFYSVQDYELQYSQLLNATNCTDLACLRSLESTKSKQRTSGHRRFQDNQIFHCFLMAL